MAGRIRVALAQLESAQANIEKNVGNVLWVLENYEADIYVFPELYLAGYYSRDLLPRLALDLESKPVRKLVQELTRRRPGSALAVGFPEKTGYGFMYNSLLLASQKGVMVYRKRHLPTFTVFDEARWFRPYRGRLEPWDTGHVLAGTAICYDVFYPEIFRAYTLMGAKLLVVVSASPDQSVPLFHKVLRARALENTCYLVWVNLVGYYDGVGFGGASLALDPMGDTVAQLKPYREQVEVVELDMARLERARRDRPVIRDAHIEDAIALLKAYKRYEEL